MADFKVIGKVVIDDNNNLKVVGAKAKKASKEVDKVGKSAHTADRRLKGAAQASSNTSKNFSKMSQGISGGLVPAYATLAASLFALGAVYRSLQEAANFETLQKSQAVYAASTGVALDTVARKLQIATGHQIDLQKAGESAAIMIAKGYNTSQIEEVAKASRGAAQALGRNFEDTFNRIVQGTTKAEPELLDELGITLRLKKATEDYGRLVGKNADELTTYERSQAVLNETLRQAAENFGEIGEKVPVNAFNRLGIVFSDLIKNFQVGIAPIANFFANVLSNNVKVAALAIGLFAASIIKQVIPSQTELTERLQNWSNTHTASYEKAKQDLDEYRQKVEQTKQGVKAARAAGATGVQSSAKVLAKGSDSPVLQRAATGKMRGADKSNLDKALRSAEAQYKKHGKIVTGIFKNKDIAVVRSLQTSFTQMNMQSQGWFAKTKMVVKRVELSFRTLGTRIKAGWTGVMAGMGAITAGFVTFVNKAMSKAGFIGLLVLAGQMIMDLLLNIDRIYKSILGGVAKVMDFLGFEETADNLRTHAEKVGETGMMKYVKDMREGKQANMEFNESLSAQQRILSEVNTIVDGFKNKNPQGLKADEIRANALNTSGIIGEIAKVQAIQDPEKQEQYAKGVRESFKRLTEIIPELAAFGDVVNLDQDALGAFVLKITSTGQALKGLKNIQESTETRRSDAYKGFRSGFFGQEAASIEKAMDEIANKAAGDVLTSSDLTYFEKILGIKLDGSTVGEVRTQATEAVRAIDSVLKNRQQRLIDGEGLKADLAGLSGRKDAGARFAREKIQIKQNNLATLAANDKIVEQRYKMRELKDDDLLNAQKELELLEKQRDVIIQQSKAYEKSTTDAFKIQQTFAQGIEKMFYDIAMGAATAKEAFKSLFTLIVQEMAKIASAKLAASIMALPVFGLAEGGIIPMAKGGVMKGYSSGGVATEPTYLVGEGKHNEAVVPLPDGRSIPVDMKGATGGNNISVNVNMTTGETSSEGSGDDMYRFGKAVAGAVQTEIQKQQRPGGMLSPF
jgi:hypothetical protein